MCGMGSARGLPPGSWAKPPARETDPHDEDACAGVANGISARAAIPRRATDPRCVITLIVLRSWARTTRLAPGPEPPRPPEAPPQQRSAYHRTREGGYPSGSGRRGVAV